MTPNPTHTLDWVCPEIVRAIEQAAREALSPWRDRAGAAAYLHCGVSTIDAYLAAGELTPKYVGNKPLVAVKDLERLLEADTRKRNRAQFSLSRPTTKLANGKIMEAK